MKRWFIGLLFLLVLPALACGSEGATTAAVSQAPVVQAAEEPVAEQAPPPQAAPTTAAIGTPRPEWLPADAVKVEMPPIEGAPTPPEVWATPATPLPDLVSLMQTRGYVLCPEETWTLEEEGFTIFCPGQMPDTAPLLAATAKGGTWAVSDLGLPFGDAVGATLVVVAFGVIVYEAIELAPRILMAKNPNILPPIPTGAEVEGLPAPPDHVKNHGRGAYTSRLKTLFWYQIMRLWQDAMNGGPEPDWCGNRPDGAIIVFFADAMVTTITGKLYEGAAVIIHSNGVDHSTVLSKVTWGNDGKPDSGNARENDFAAFTQMDQCPPPPGVVAR